MSAPLIFPDMDEAITFSVFDGFLDVNIQVPGLEFEEKDNVSSFLDRKDTERLISWLESNLDEIDQPRRKVGQR